MKSFSEMTIALASDHAGFELKQQVQLFLEDNGAKVKDFGCFSAESCDYPDFAQPLAEAVEKGEYEFGALDIVRTFFQTDFEGGRHERRVNKIAMH